MKIWHVLYEGVKFQGQPNNSISKDRLKRPMSPFLEVGVQKFFDSHMKNYIGKLKMVKWNRFDNDCKNE